MATALKIEPDVTFIEHVMKSGGGELKKCYQCATCSTVCSLSMDDAPFPRGQILKAQWGMKEQVLSDPAIWLCHNCGDCNVNCPRGARPGDIIGALRQAAIEQFAVPRFMGALAGSLRGLAVLLLLPVLLFLAVALWAPKPAAPGRLEFAAVFPIGVLEPLFFAVCGLAALAFASSMARFVRALRVSGATGPILPGLIPALREIAAHSRFSKCGRGGSRRLGHLLVFWGFLGLALVGTAVGVATMGGWLSTPLALTNPLKVFANVCAAVILAGCITLLVWRATDPDAANTYFDWLFLLTLTGVALTGSGSELLRLAGAAGAMYAVYFVHLVLVFALLLYAPYSKFAHLVSRTVAMAATARKS